jgi:hypothetical protein
MVDVGTGSTTFASNLASGFSKIQFVFSKADLTIKTVDANGVSVSGNILSNGVAETGSVTISNYLSGEKRFLTTTFSGTTFHADNIDLALFRPGHTVRVSASTGALLPEGPALSNNQAEIQVVYPPLVTLTVEAVDQNGAALAGGHAETSGNWTVSGNPTATIPNFPSGSALNVKGSYNGVGSASFTPVTPQADKTIWVNGLTGTVESTTNTPGQTG